MSRADGHRADAQESPSWRKTSDGDEFRNHRGNRRDIRGLAFHTSDDRQEDHRLNDSRADRQVNDDWPNLRQGNRREMGKTSDDVELNQHRGNRRGVLQFGDDRSIGRGTTNGDVAEDRRGNKMKEDKAQLNHSSDPD